MGRAKLFVLLIVVLVFLGCEAAPQHKSLGQPSAAALAPQPLPLLPPSPALRALNTPGDASARMAAMSVLIDQAEAAYTQGLNDYQSGDMEKAKQEFDRSLAVLLESKFDLRDNDRLSQEFDLLAQNINDVEIAAFRNGNALSQHQYVPTPIESFAGLTFPVDPNAMRKVQEEMRSVHLDIPIASNESVSGVISYLQQHARGYLQNVLERIGKYRPMISRALRQQGLPQDLIYLPGPESAFNPHATSRRGARGIWQLMSETARLYGLKENRWVDEREDPYMSTQAAALYLKYLYQTFGDWYLALAAYDSGPGAIQRAIQRTGYADYWKLRQLHALLPETENYVPIFLATALIAKDPAAYGFNVSPDPPLKADRVSVRVPTDLRLVAGLIDRPVDDLVKLNPDLRGWATPADDPGFVLNLPAGTKALFEQRIAAVPAAKRLWWRAQQVTAGDTLAGIAAQYHVTRLALARANHLGPEDDPVAGSCLLIPLSPVRARRLASVRWVRRPYYYRVERGDNLDIIADRFDVTAYQIRRWNHLRSSHLVRGKTLLVYRRVAVARPAARRRKRYTHRASR